MRTKIDGRGRRPMHPNTRHRYSERQFQPVGLLPTLVFVNWLAPAARSYLGARLPGLVAFPKGRGQIPNAKNRT
jgi:hypothetical protein